MNFDSPIYIAGHGGLVGSALVKQLQSQGYNNLILKTRAELDLTRQSAVEEFFSNNKIDYVVVAAGKVGGIKYNRFYQADFLYENVLIASNVIKAAADSNVKKLLFLGSSCVYPRLAEQPIDETSLLAGPLEPTNEGYALAKITGIKLCEKYFEQYNRCFISAMPTNLYGPNDNFDLETSHVIPALIHKFHQAKINSDPYVAIWGSGQSMREFLYVDDLAAAIVVLLKDYNQKELINIGTGEDLKIIDLANIIKEVVGYDGEIKIDLTQPDGMPRKVLNVDKIKNLGWNPSESLQSGLEKTYQWVLNNNILG